MPLKLGNKLLVDNLERTITSLDPPSQFQVIVFSELAFLSLFLHHPLYTVSSKNHRIINITLVRTYDIFMKFGGLIRDSSYDTTAGALPTKPV